MTNPPKEKDTPKEAANELEEDEIWEAEYKLQNCIRITLDVEHYKTEVYTGKRWMPVSEYVLYLIESKKVKARINELEWAYVSDYESIAERIKELKERNK